MADLERDNADLRMVNEHLRRELAAAIAKAPSGRSIVALVDIVITVTLSGRICYLNSAGEHHFKVFRAEVIGLPVDTLVSPHLDGITLLDVSREAVASRNVMMKDVLSKDGKTHWAIKATCVDQGVQFLISDNKSKRNESLIRYVSPKVIDSVVGSGVDWSQPVRHDVTLVHTSLAGFAARCDQLPALEAKRLFEQYLSVVVETFADEGAAVDRGVADQIIAVFGVPVPTENPTLVALNAVLRVQEAFGRLQTAWEKSGGARLSQRIGMTSGDVVAGTMGSSGRTDFVLLGSQLAVVGALAASAKEDEILMSDRTFEIVKTILTHRPEGVRRPVKFRKAEDVFVRETGAKIAAVSVGAGT